MKIKEIKDKIIEFLLGDYIESKLRKGFKIGEIPIIFIDREKGASKMSKKIVYEAIFMVWKLRFKSIAGTL